MAESHKEEHRQEGVTVGSFVLFFYLSLNKKVGCTTLKVSTSVSFCRDAKNLDGVTT